MQNWLTSSRRYMMSVAVPFPPSHPPESPTAPPNLDMTGPQKFYKIGAE